MHIELIDILRCTRPHEDTWLVAAFERLVDRRVVDGLLSCPVCGARYPIAGGVAYFDVAPAELVAENAVAQPDLAVRAAAFLNFSEGARLVLAGSWGAAAESLAELGATVLVLNASRNAAGASQLHTAGGLPCAAGSVSGVALDLATAGAVESAVRALKPRGRLVAPAACPLPEGVTEITRDAEWWIAERPAENVSAPIRLRRS